MTLSNFDWTDKQSLKWFLMLPTGHEGPYSIDILSRRFSQNKISPEIQVWAEGISQTLALRELFMRSEGQELADDLPPPLPLMPGFAEDVFIPPMPSATGKISRERQPNPVAKKIAETAPVSTVEELPEKPFAKKIRKLPLALFVLILFVPLSGFFGYQWIKEQEKFSIPRYPRMSLEIHKRVLEAFSFESWDKTIFFKEFVSGDLANIWLVTSGYQNCKVEAEFSSVPEKLLSLTDSKVAFRSQGKLSGHVVELTKFEFTQGSKIIRGLYEMQVKATSCGWDGLLPKITNKFQPPQESYEATTKVVLFEGGAVEFNQILDQLNQKKMVAQLKVRGQQDHFWDDLQQKLQTLQAITLQIEQMLVDFTETQPKDFHYKLKPMVEGYTRKFGHFLTNFVVANETYFAELSKGELRPLTVKKNYEQMVRLTSKKVGLTSMTVIENLQRLKKPDEAQLKEVRRKLLESFSKLKEEISLKIIEVTEDRSL